METVINRELRNHRTFTVEIRVNNVFVKILIRSVIADSLVKSEIPMNNIHPVDTTTLIIISS